ncbi:heme NO-binding protein [Litorivita pollutaquae]|uniref:Heme NO-binding protein n=1 Tax=Litorivita pollutaquae TaxID=2200892 RepID=A0A2V4MMH4_9RHOB|nr:heme NO-binding domain-containing protein [Litorivita pollutaquae]PYC46799.1 heme NO-binding protein [Litorivita pollutaquae]
MHGLINTALQSFTRDIYGDDAWAQVMNHADLGFSEFEAMLIYEDEQTCAVLGGLELVLRKPREEVLEDIGTYLVSNPKVESLRRLLRFGGVNFIEFLQSLDDLPGRARLAVSDLDLPVMELSEYSVEHYALTLGASSVGFGHVMLGLLRAMADDYGALVMMEYGELAAGRERIEIRLLETDFTEGRSFHLGGKAG